MSPAIRALCWLALVCVSVGFAVAAVVGIAVEARGRLS